MQVTVLGLVSWVWFPLPPPSPQETLIVKHSVFLFFLFEKAVAAIVKYADWKDWKIFLAVAEQATMKKSLEKQRQFYFSD